MVDDPTLKAWFFREIFPLEGSLTRFLRRHWRRTSEAEDLRQEIYMKVYEAAASGLPAYPKAFLFATARNHLASCARRERVVSFDLMADLDGLGLSNDLPTPERDVVARDELRRMHRALDRLPPRLREVVKLRRIEDLSAREVAARLNVAVTTVDEQLARAIRLLADGWNSTAVLETPATRRRLGHRS
jgi:RNA polymerase sigma-70 factor (ECF subfamily)